MAVSVTSAQNAENTLYLRRLKKMKPSDKLAIANAVLLIVAICCALTAEDPRLALTIVASAVFLK